MIISMKHVFMNYEKHVPVIYDLNMDIEKGEFVFLVGPSGAGKTTILRMIYREIKPTSGQIIVAGQDLSRLKDHQVPYYRRKLGLIFQDFKLLPDRTVAQNVALSMQVAGMKPKHIKRNVDKVLEWLNLSHRRDAFPDEISVGERQRTAIARAIVNFPSVILADEPTGNLDPKLASEVMQILDEFNRNGTTIIVATHDVSLAEQLNHRVIEISNGRLIR